MPGTELSDRVKESEPLTKYPDPGVVRSSSVSVSDAMSIRLAIEALTSTRDRLSKPLATASILVAVDSVNVMESEALFRKDATLTELSVSVSVSDALRPTEAIKSVASTKVMESEESSE
jgi:hypothetical protein